MRLWLRIAANEFAFAATIGLIGCSLIACAGLPALMLAH